MPLKMYSAIMKQKVIRIIKRLIGHRILVHPIVDANVYDANENSFSGNSLQDSNVLIVGCDELLCAPQNVTIKMKAAMWLSYGRAIEN